MSHAPSPAPPAPCVWMSAGLVAYKLCDRGFDCERCPLDRALSGAAGETGPRHEPGAIEFPAGLAFTHGHTWLRQVGGEGAARFRFGIDALAALLVGRSAGVRCGTEGERVAAGETLATVEAEAGAVPLAAPVAGRVRRGNAALERDPGLASREPYDRGWLLELAVERPEEVFALVRPDAAREQATLDLRHLRRRIALGLLAEADGVGPTLADGGERLTDLRRILGPDAYLPLLREIVR